jgi:methyl-accepting chemotaxis protein
VIQQNASAAEEMASTTEELTGQSDQLLSALGCFRTGDSAGGAAPRKPTSKASGSLAKLHEAVAHHAPAARKPARAGVALNLRETADTDKEFERF